MFEHDGIVGVPLEEFVRRAVWQERGRGDRHGGEDADGVVTLVRDEHARTQVAAVAGRATIANFGTVVSDTSPRFIRTPAFSRISSSRSRNAASAFSSSHDSYPVMPTASARITTTGIPLSTSVQSTPATSSTEFPVGRSAPHELPAMASKSSRIAAAVPGTPDTAVDPVSTSRPSWTGKCAVAIESVLIMWMRTRASPSANGQQAPLDGERADTGQQVAAVLAVGDEAFADTELQEQVLEVGAIIGRERDDRDL